MHIDVVFKLAKQLIQCQVAIREEEKYFREHPSPLSAMHLNKAFAEARGLCRAMAIAAADGVQELEGDSLETEWLIERSCDLWHAHKKAIREELAESRAAGQISASKD